MFYISTVKSLSLFISKIITITCHKTKLPNACKSGENQKDLEEFAQNYERDSYSRE